MNSASAGFLSGVERSRHSPLRGHAFCETKPSAFVVKMMLYRPYQRKTSSRSCTTKAFSSTQSESFLFRANTVLEPTVGPPLF